MTPQRKPAFSATNSKPTPENVLGVSIKCEIGEELWKK
jgi:hypothetical protein